MSVCFVCQDNCNTQIKCCTCKEVFAHETCLTEYIKTKNRIGDSPSIIYACPHCRTEFRNITYKKNYKISKTKQLDCLKKCCWYSFQLLLWISSIIYVLGLISAMITLCWVIDIYRKNKDTVELDNLQKIGFITYLSIIIPYILIEYTIYLCVRVCRCKYQRSQKRPKIINDILVIFNLLDYYTCKWLIQIMYGFNDCLMFRDNNWDLFFIDLNLLSKSKHKFSFVLIWTCEVILVVFITIANSYLIHKFHSDGVLDTTMTIYIGWSGIILHFMVVYLPFILVKIMFVIIIFFAYMIWGLCACFVKGCMDVEEVYQTDNGVRNDSDPYDPRRTSV